MDETTSAPLNDHLAVAVDIVSAYVSNNVVQVSGLPALTTSVHATIAGLGQTNVTDEGAVEKATPTQIKKSITPDTLISFEDGKPYKTLRRHLTKPGLSPEAYREKHGLPRDYPMTAAAYSAQRSQLAKNLGLGQQRRSYAKAEVPEAEAPAEPVGEAAPEKPKRAGRPARPPRRRSLPYRVWYGPRNRSPRAFRWNRVRQRRRRCSGASCSMWQRWQNAARFAPALLAVS